MNSISLKVNAKVNLSLNVTGLANNGYHCLDMVMASVNIYDEIQVTKRRDRNISAVMYDSFGKIIDIKPEMNNAYKAAVALRDGFRLSGCDIKIIKHIPFAAGLGGSSADSAGVICSVARLFNLDVKSSSAYIIAFKSGSDVPYMLEGGYAHVYGRGEKVNLIPCEQKIHLVIAKGKDGCLTKDVYSKFDALNNHRKGNTLAMIKAFSECDLEAVALNVKNDLQEPAICICPQIQNTLDILNGTKPLASAMTGSGSACFGIYKDKESSERACAEIKDKFEYCVSTYTLKSGFSDIVVK